MVFTRGILAKGGNGAGGGKSGAARPQAGPRSGELELLRAHDDGVTGRRADLAQGLVEPGALDDLLQVRDGVLVIEVRLGEQALDLDAAHHEVLAVALHGEGLEAPLLRTEDSRRSRSGIGGVRRGLRLAGAPHDAVSYTHLRAHETRH